MWVLRTGVSALAAAIVALAGAAAAHAGFVPALGSPFPYAAPTTSLAVIDRDRNGTVDVAAGGAPLALRPGAGTGFLGNPIAIGSPGAVEALVAGDLNGDTLIDYAAIAPGAGSGEPRVLRFLATAGNGFVADVAIDAAPGATALAIGDVDGGGLPDLVVAHDEDADPEPGGEPGVQDVTVLLGGPPADDALERRSSGLDAPSDVELGDLTGDGLPEIVVAGATGASVSVLRNQGAGTFADGELEPTGGSGPSPRIALAQLDGDGRLDLLATEIPFSVVRLLGDGDGGFGAPAELPSGLLSDPVRSVTAADVDGDGLTDVVVGGGNQFAALLGDGRGGVRHTPGADAYATGSRVAGDSVADVVAADMNRDGQVDVVTANRGGSVSVLLNDQTGLLGAAPASVDFGTLMPATGIRSTTVTLRAERGRLRITRLDRQGSRNFSVRDGDCVGRTLLLGQSCSLTVSFNTPRKARRYEALLSVDANAAAVVIPLAAKPRAPIVRRVRLKRKRVAPGRRLGLRYSLSEGALTRVLTERALPGRRVGGRCVAARRGNLRRRRCTLWARVAAVKRRDLGGANRMRVATRAKPVRAGRKRRRGAAYPPGAYRLSVSALDRYRNRSPERRVRFKLARRKR